MPGLDLFTLNCVTIINLFLSSGAMYFVARVNRQNAGIKNCAFAGLCLGTGFVVSAFRVKFPSHFLNLLANLMIFGGSFLMFEGVRVFRGAKRFSPRVRIGTLGFYALIYSFWLYEIDSLVVRTVFASLAVGLFMVGAGWSMGVRANRRDRAVYWGTASIYGIQGLAVILRGVRALISPPQSSLFASGLTEFLIICSINLSSISTAFGLSLATNLKLSHESERLALYDPLTNLPNRRLFEERLEEAESRALAGRGSIALIYCDLDDFKQINDTLGHAAGDQVLRAVADRLRSTLHESACLARVGGDEFVVLIENAEPRAQLLELIQELSLAVEERLQVADRTISPRISCGLAIYPDDVGSVSDLVRLADAAMYAMKQHGRPISEETTPGWPDPVFRADSPISRV